MKRLTARGLLALALLFGITSQAEAVISRTGQAFARYGSGNTTIDSASFPGSQLGANESTGYYGVSNATIDVGAQGYIAESVGILSAMSGLIAGTGHPADTHNYFFASGGGATFIHSIDVTSGSLPLYTPVQVKFKLGVAYDIEAIHTFGTPGSNNNNAFAAATVQANVTGLSSVFLSGNDNRAYKSTLTGDELQVGLMTGSQEIDFIIDSEVGGSITFALVIDADTNGDAAGTGNPIQNNQAHAWSSLAVAYGAGPANGEDIQLSVTGPAASFPSLDNVTAAYASSYLPANPFSPQLPGDLNGDGFVGLDDLDIILNNWNQTIPPADPLADPSGDAYVGLDDLDIVLNNWNTGTPPLTNTQTIPEPAAMVIMLIATLSAVRYRGLYC